MQSGSFADFLSQMPIEIIAIFILFTLLTIIILGLLIYLRIRRSRIAKPVEASGSNNNMLSFGKLFKNTAQSPITQAVTSNNTEYDMPDLDMLLSMTASETTQQSNATNTVNSDVPDLDELHAIMDTQEKTSAPINVPVKESLQQHPGFVNVKLTKGDVIEAAEMLIILRDRRTNKLIVKIGEHAYNGDENDFHPEFSKKFVELMREMSDIAPVFAKGAKVRKLNDAPKPQTDRTTPPKIVVKSTEKQDSNSDTLDLAGQIEAFLQRKLLLNSQFEGRELHVHSAEDGGVNIQVDSEYFSSVADITDAKVRQFLSDTILEWQSQS